MMEMEQYRSEKLHEECGVFAVYDKSLVKLDGYYEKEIRS